MKGMKCKGLIAILFVLIVAGGGIFAASNLVLTGSVSQSLYIDVVGESGYDSLTFLVDQTDLLVATTTETSNKRNYVVKMHSTNGSKLVHTVDSSEYVEYTFSYGDITDGTLTPTPTTVFTGVTKASNVTRPLTITYSGNILLLEGSYTDEIFFTIVAT